MIFDGKRVIQYYIDTIRKAANDNSLSLNKCMSYYRNNLTQHTKICKNQNISFLQGGAIAFEGDSFRNRNRLHRVTENIEGPSWIRVCKKGAHDSTTMHHKYKETVGDYDVIWYFDIDSITIPYEEWIKHPKVSDFIIKNTLQEILEEK